MASLQFGIAWVAFTLAVAVHVADEATHDFLATYNPAARATRARFPFLPVPTFRFGVWLGLLGAGVALLLALSPLAFRGAGWLRIASWPLAILAGVVNACLHLGSSLYFRRRMPGVYSSPLLLAASIWLLTAL